MIYDGVIVKPPIEQLLIHSGIKGMEWKNHKYIRKLNGTYYYPEGNSDGSLSNKDIENLANEVIKGNFGNGQDRKDLLGDDYQQVQDLVNDKLKNKSKSKTNNTEPSNKKVVDDSEYEVKEGNNHYKYKVKKK